MSVIAKKLLNNISIGIKNAVNEIYDDQYDNYMKKLNSWIDDDDSEEDSNDDSDDNYERYDDGYEDYYDYEAWEERNWEYYMNKFVYSDPDDPYYEYDPENDDDDSDVYDDDVVTLLQQINAYLNKYEGFDHLNKNDMSRHDWKLFKEICQDFADCYPKYWDEINSDCHFDEIINNSTINEAWGDNFDRSHNAPASKLKKSINNYFNNFAISTLFSPSAKKGFMDIHVLKNTNTKYPKLFGINVVERKSTKTDNFRIQIPRTGENVFDDTNVNFIAFITADQYMGDYYNVYVVKKNDVNAVYKKLTLLYNRCKEEVKLKTRNRKTLNTHALSDKYHNFLAPTQGGDGLSLTLDFLEAKAIDKFRTVI